MAKKKLSPDAAVEREDRGTARRNHILEQLADHVLATGLDAASLRPLAAAVGTSDRMLLYYFPDKATLVSSILGCIVARLLPMLDEQIPPDRRLDSDEMVRERWKLLRRPKIHPYMRIWLELAGHAARGEEPHRTIGATIANGFIDWIEQRLALPGLDARRTSATVLTQIEGMLLLDAFGIEPQIDEGRATRRRR